MKNFAVTFALAAILTLLVQLPAADAAPLTAADFAADCNDDGHVSVSGTRTYVGGRGYITRFCGISRTPSSNLVFDGVSITSTASLVAIDTLNNDTLKVVDSTFKIEGVLELTSGCCSGGEPSVDERYGTVVVEGSSLLASHIELSASREVQGGYVLVSDSRLEATAVSKHHRVMITASWASGTYGAVDISDTKIVTRGRGALIASGNYSKTYVRNSAFNRVPAVSSGVGGYCSVYGSSPYFGCV